MQVASSRDSCFSFFLSLLPVCHSEVTLTNNSETLGCSVIVIGFVSFEKQRSLKNFDIETDCAVFFHICCNTCICTLLCSS